MEVFFLKSAACLAILLLFYKLILEKENMHNFKRFYLVFSVVASLVIPFITFTTYIEPSTGTFDPVIFSSEATSGTLQNNYWQYFFPGIYITGVIFFGVKFFRNLKDLLLKIKKNERIRKKNITNVLLSEKALPHTFFHYIFFNKREYLDNEIPKDVEVHEEAHARQLHSFDVIFLEMLQIISWLNPFIYLLKNAVKLNHEFLADRAVLKQGYATSLYQQTLLSYSSGDLQNQLVNPINYSSIKKRFTVMKTQTSKTAFLVRSFLIMPLIALLFYGFSNEAVVVKDSENVFIDQEMPVKTIKFKNQQESSDTASTEYQNLFMVPQAPPPPNKNTIIYVRELAKRGATFYIGPHKYSEDEVLQMVKKSTNEILIDVSQYPNVRINGC